MRDRPDLDMSSGGRSLTALDALRWVPLTQQECLSLLGPTGGTLRYDAIAPISFANKRVCLLESRLASARTLYKNLPLP